MALRAKSVITLHRDGGLPEDQVVNTMHWEADNAVFSEGDRAEWDILAPGLVDRIKQFYTSIQAYLSPVLSGQLTIDLIDMQDPLPQFPRVSEPHSITPANGALPSEVAIALSFVGIQESGALMRRRRGRIFVGPLATTTVASLVSTAPDVRVDADVGGFIVAAAVEMAHGDSGSFRLAIYSPTQDGLAVGTDDAWNDVKTIYVDNAFDTIRKRGAVATQRTQVVLTG